VFLADYIYICRFLDRQPTSGSSDGEKNNRIRVALFGLGRMGTIHLGNILANTRIELAYAVEANPDLSNWVKNKYNLRETKFIHPKVYTYQLLVEFSCIEFEQKV
jgi:predicted dehydrogenase